MRASENLQEVPDAYTVHDFSDWRSWPHQQLLEKMRSVHVVMTGRKSPKFPSELIEARGKLQWHCHFHGSVRYLVSREHIEAGLTVTNWGCSMRPVAEGAVALLLATIKQIKQADLYSQTGQDRRFWQGYFPSLPHMRTGLYGLGPIGRNVAEMLLALGARLSYYDPYAEDVPETIRRCDSLAELFESSDAVVVVCGLNDQTRGTVDKTMLEKLPRAAALINVARGPVVVEQDLADLVAQGRILAGCDVICDESDWPASPLAGLDAACLTHHQVGVGKGYHPDEKPLNRYPDFVMENLRSFAAGRPLIYTIAPEEYDLKT